MSRRQPMNAGNQFIACESPTSATVTRAVAVAVDAVRRLRTAERKGTTVAQQPVGVVTGRRQRRSQVAWQWTLEDRRRPRSRDSSRCRRLFAGR